MSRAVMGRWDVDLGDGPDGACFYGLESVNDWLSNGMDLERTYFDGSVWAACFDLRWRFVALHQFVGAYRRARVASRACAGTVRGNPWLGGNSVSLKAVTDSLGERERERRRREFLGSAGVYARGYLDLRSGDLFADDIEKTPLDTTPQELWDGVLWDVAEDREGVREDARVRFGGEDPPVGGFIQGAAAIRVFWVMEAFRIAGVPWPKIAEELVDGALAVLEQSRAEGNVWGVGVGVAEARKRARAALLGRGAEGARVWRQLGVDVGRCR